MPAKKKRKVITNLQANQGFIISGSNNNLSESSVTNNQITIDENIPLAGINQGYQVEGDSNILTKAKIDNNKIEQLANEEEEEEQSANILASEKLETTNEPSSSQQVLKRKISQTSLPQDNQKEALLSLLVKKHLNKDESLETISFCHPWWNEYCAIVISKKVNRFTKDEYSLSIAVYEPAFGKVEADLQLIKVNKKITPIKENWTTIIESFKTSLNSDNPAANLFNNAYTTELPSLVKDYPNIVQRKLKVKFETNPNDYLKPYDIIKRKMPLPYARHIAIYLGNGQVAHISANEESSNFKDLGANYDTWENFLKGEQEIEIEHCFIPFKRTEEIKQHIDLAVKANYGQGKYNLLGNNCEHFATMCVYGIGMSLQSGKVNTINSNSKYLIEAIKESNKFFNELAENQAQLTAKVEQLIINN